MSFERQLRIAPADVGLKRTMGTVELKTGSNVGKNRLTVTFCADGRVKSQKEQPRDTKFHLT